MKNPLKYSLLFSVTLVLVSCEYYLGMDQQPKFRSQNFEEGLNVFALISPDTLNGNNASFAYVHQLVPVLEQMSFSILKNVNISIGKVVSDNEITDSVVFSLIPGETVSKDTMYRPVSDFSPRPGERYRMICRYNGLPDAVGETVIPPKPKIAENSLVVDGRKVIFTVEPDTLIGMLDIYHVKDNAHVLAQRIVPSETEPTAIELNLLAEASGSRLMLYSYDKNMAVYCGNANISLNFNKYRTPISTLQSGFGIFGSINFTELNLGLSK
ncbi:MAG: hypothetical protein R6W78_16710 [Bacteroidales bacterium]